MSAALSVALSVAGSTVLSMITRTMPYMPTLWYHSDGALVLCAFHSVMRLVEQGLADHIAIGITDTASEVLQHIITQRPTVGTAHRMTSIGSPYPRRVKNSTSFHCDQCYR